ncbi:MAG: hypothetical protein ACRENP_15340 [Longimicrobiales bacterium]
MNRTLAHALRQALFVIAAVGVVAGCSDEPPLAPEPQPVAQEMEPAIAEQAARVPAAEAARAIATLMAATVRYHNLNTAIADGFVLLHPCEERPGEGPVGTVYVHMGRLVDGKIDPAKPDALIYEPSQRKNGRPQLVGVEFAFPYSMWSGQEPPKFLGNSFQPEDEFGVFALHVWVWKFNPEGLFAESNPRVSCGEE